MTVGWCEVLWRRVERLDLACRGAPLLAFTSSSISILLTHRQTFPHITGGFAHCQDFLLSLTDGILILVAFTNVFHSLLRLLSSYDISPAG